MVVSSSRRLSNSWEIGRRELGLRTCLLVSSNVRLSLRVTLLTASSRVASVFLRSMPLCKVARPLLRAFASCLTKYPLSFVPHRQHSVSRERPSLQYPDHGLRGCHSSHPHHLRSSVEHPLELGHPLKAQHRPHEYPDLPPRA